MPRFAANLSLLFNEMPLMERFRAAREAGFEGVEILFPYDDPAQDLRDQLVWNSLSFVLLNHPPPNFTGGPQGFAAVPGAEERFRRDFERVLRYAGVLKPAWIHVMAGKAQGEAARRTMVANLRWASSRAPAQGLTIEPLNNGDFPDYFLSDLDLAAGIIAEVGAPNLRLQFDTYHAQAITGDALAAWTRHGAIVGHVQIGGHPGRTEPDRGELDHRAFFERLDADGYKGWVSAEYRPVAGTLAGLGWLTRRG
ncbi:MAG: TIM barrel protein [Rhodobacteraceae bacterium]|nr:TIM barrel protein [Paracoccaceae bacterium]